LLDLQSAQFGGTSMYRTGSVLKKHASGLSILRISSLKQATKLTTYEAQVNFFTRPARNGSIR